MKYVYLILKNIRYLLKNKKTITILIIIVLLFMFAKSIFATDGSSGGGFRDTSGFGVSVAKDEYESLLAYIRNRILVACEDDISGITNIILEDIDSRSYKVVTASIVDWSRKIVDNFDIGFYANSGNICLYTVYENGTVTKDIQNYSNGSYRVLSDVFPDLFVSKYNLLCWYNGNSLFMDSYYEAKAYVSRPDFIRNAETNFPNDSLVISPCDADIQDSNILPFELLIYNNDGGIESKFILNESSTYFDSENRQFVIPLRPLDVMLVDGNVYKFQINLFNNNFYTTYELFTCSWVDNDIPIINSSNNDNEDNSSDNENLKDYSENFNNMQNAINGTTIAIDNMSNTISNSVNEVNETNKGIWGTLQSILNFINPASEDFFVYQLIRLLIDALKSLFVPSDEFLNNWVADMNEWLGDRLGALYFPEEILIDFLTRIGDIAESSTAIIHIPQFDLEFMGYRATVFNEYYYDLNSILENETYRNIHTVYLVITDVILWLGLVVLAYNTFTTVFGGKYMDSALTDAKDSYDKHKVKEEIKERERRPIGFGSNWR